MLLRAKTVVMARSMAAGICVLLLFESLSRTRLVSPALLPPMDLVLVRMFRPDVLMKYAVSMVPLTFAWALGAWIIGLGATGLLAAACQKSPSLSAILGMAFVGGRVLPSVIAVPLFVTLFGSSRITAAICCCFLVMAYSHPTFEEGLRALARTREAIREVVTLSRGHELLLIALPGVAQAWKAIALQSFGIALVVTVAAEMILSFSGSIGDEVAKMAWLLRMTDVYALVGWLFIWAVVVKYFVDQLPMVLEWPSRRIMEEVKRRTLLPD